MRRPHQHRILGALLAALTLASSITPARAWTPGDDFQDSHCKQEKDEGGDVVEVCRAIYGGGKMYLGVYWKDGSEVVGPCSTSDPEPIEYKGMTKKDAQSWVDSYCQ